MARLSRLRRGEAIVTAKGDPTLQFQLLWQNALQVIEAQAEQIADCCAGAGLGGGGLSLEMDGGDAGGSDGSLEIDGGGA